MLMLSGKNTGNSAAGKAVLKLDKDFFYNAHAGDSNTYVKVGDKHGAYYTVTPAGLRINDRQGYIRTAKPK